MSSFKGRAVVIILCLLDVEKTRRVLKKTFTTVYRKDAYLIPT
jgi:hypothetical protein